MTNDPDESGDHDDDRAVAPDRPTIDDPEVSALTERDRRVQRALIDEINPAGLDTFDRDQWKKYGQAICEYKGISADDVVLVVDDDGVELVDRGEYLKQCEAVAATADLASKYLRRIDGWTPDEIAGKSDLEISRLFLERKGYLPVDDETTSTGTED